MKSECEATVLRLASGRLLAFRECGDALGVPVFGFHGTPGSRIQLSGLDPDARVVGVRLLLPDRPGFGLSDFDPKRRLVDWPGDVLAIAEYLGLERFGVFGVSGGGPHAAVCAHALGERLLGACIVSGVGPLGEPGAMEGAMPSNRALFAVARGAPWLMRWMMGFFVWLQRRLGPRALGLFARQLPEADRRILAREDMQTSFLDELRRSSSTTARAAAQDMVLFARPFGFAYEEIAIPVHLWQGDQDRNVPAFHATLQAGRIPDATVHECPGEGHLLVAERGEEILRAASGQAAPPVAGVSPKSSK